MTHAVLIYNPHAGQALVRREMQNVLAYLAQSGWQAQLWETTQAGEATALARRAVQRGAEVVVAVGGDGTLNEVASGMVGADAALGVLPVGTTNVWALQMQIPALDPISPGGHIAKFVSELEEQLDEPLPINHYRATLLRAARTLVHGRTVAVDVGQIAGRYFLMWAGIGLDAAITQSVPPAEKRALGSWAFVIPTLDTVQEYHSVDVTLTVDDHVLETRTSLIVVSNIQLYGAVLPLGAKARVDDGLLDVCIFKGEGLLTFVRHALTVLSQRHMQDPAIEYYQCRRLAVESTHPLPVHADDEPFTQTPVVAQVLPQALQVIVPQNAPRDLFSAW